MQKLNIDGDLQREIEELIGDGSREARLAAMKKIRATKAVLSTTRIRSIFNDVIREHGRAAVAICVAATLDRLDRRSDWTGMNALEEWLWSWDVMVLLKQGFKREQVAQFVIDDGLNPTAICDYAWPFIRLTLQEG